MIVEPLRVCVTGAAGQIAYSLLGSITDGSMFGMNQRIILHLLDIEPAMTVLKGVEMELYDCASPLLEEVVLTSNPKIAFKDIDVALLIGAMPRKEGMSRRDLLKANVAIFKEQGLLLNELAKKSAKVLCGGNPANTNCWITMKYAPSIPKENFSALTRLDQNRAVSSVARKLGVNPKNVINMIIWGNHSSTQFPDASFVKILDYPKPGQVSSLTTTLTNDLEWLHSDFIVGVQERGAAVIAARKLSSALSAARAITNHMHDWWFGTRENEITSMAVVSDGSYGIPEGTIFSFPVTCKGGRYFIHNNEKLDEFSKQKLQLTLTELLEEQNEALLAVKEA